MGKVLIKMVPQGKIFQLEILKNFTIFLYLLLQLRDLELERRLHKKLGVII
jgi:hypothetical protein